MSTDDKPMEYFPEDKCKADDCNNYDDWSQCDFCDLPRTACGYCGLCKYEETHIRWR